MRSRIIELEIMEGIDKNLYLARHEGNGRLRMRTRSLEELRSQNICVSISVDSETKSRDDHCGVRKNNNLGLKSIKEL